MFNNMSNDVRKSFTAFERDNPVFRNLSKQIKSGDFGMTDNLDNKMMGFDDSLGGDLDSNLEEFNFDFGGDSSSESPSPSNENLAISQGEGMIAGQLNYQTVVSKKSTIAQLGVMSEIAKNTALTAAFHAEQTAGYYQQASEYFKLTASFQDDFTKKFDIIFKHYDDVRERKEKANRQREDAPIEDVLDPSKGMQKIWDTLNLGIIFGENGPISQFLTRVTDDPLGYILSTGGSAVTKKFFGEEVDNINSMLEGLPYKLNNTLTEWSNNSEKGIFGALKKFIGDNFKQEVNPNRKLKAGLIQEGPVDFDGKTRHSIVNVIPMYLAKILRAISKTDYTEVYSFEKGGFTTDKQLLKEHKENLLRLNKNNLGSLKSGVDDFADEHSLNGNDKKKLIAKLRALSKMDNPDMADITEIDLADPVLQAKIRQIAKSKSGKRSIRKHLYNGLLKNNYEVMENKTRFQNEFTGSDNERAVMLQNTTLHKENLSNQANYFNRADKKESVPFTDLVSKTITTVIPGYLAKILKAVSGSSDLEIYSHSDKKFISGSEAKQKFISQNNRNRMSVGMAMGVRSDLSNIDNDIFDLEDTLSSQQSLVNDKNYLIKNYKQFKNTVKNFKDWETKSKASMFSITGIPAKVANYIRTDLSTAKKYESVLNRILPPSVYNGSSDDKARFILSDAGGRELLTKLSSFNTVSASIQEDMFKKLPNSIFTESLGKMESWSAPQRKKFLLDNSETFLRLRREGGIVNGQGNGTSDSNIIRVSNGEMVINAESTKRFKSILDFINEKKNGITTASKSKFRSIMDNLVGKDEEGNTNKFTVENIKAGLEAKVDDFLDKRIFTPLENTFNKLSKFADEKILSPMSNGMKKWLIGKSQFSGQMDPDKMSLMDSATVLFNEKLIHPLKRKLLGNMNEKRKDQLVNKEGFFGIVKESFTFNVMNPFKRYLMGEKGKDLKDKHIEKLSLMYTIKNKFNESILGFKKKLVGEDNPNAEAIAKNTDIVTLLKGKLNDKVLTPFKKYLLGTNAENMSNEELKQKSVFSIVSDKANAAVERFKFSLVPMDSKLTEEQVKKMSLFSVIGDKITVQVIDPLKKKLVGEERAKDMSLFKVLTTSFNEKIVNPLKTWVFGDKEKNKESLVTNMVNSTSGFFNKLLFGFEKAENSGLWENMKSTAKLGLKWFDENYIKFTLNNLDKHILPLMKDILVEGSGLLIDKLKGLSIEFKNYTKGFLNNLLNDNTIKTLRNTIVVPLQEAIGTLTKSITSLFQKLTGGLLVKGLEGIADRIKKQRVAMGKGERYSELELERLAQGKSRLDADYINRVSQLGTKSEKKFARKLNAQLGTDTPEDVTAARTTSIDANIKTILDNMYGNTAEERARQEEAKKKLKEKQEREHKAKQDKLARDLAIRDAAREEKRKKLADRARTARLTDNVDGSLFNLNRNRNPNDKKGIFGTLIKGLLNLVNPLFWTGVITAATKFSLKWFLGMPLKGIAKLGGFAGKAISKIGGGIAGAGGGLLGGLGGVINNETNAERIANQANANIREFEDQQKAKRDELLARHQQEIELSNKRKKKELARQNISEEERRLRLQEHETELRNRQTTALARHDEGAALTRREEIERHEAAARERIDNRTEEERREDRRTNAKRKVAKAGGIGLGIAAGGAAVGDMIGGPTGEAIGTVSNYASTGAMIGALLPIPGGTLIGGLLGGGLGLVSALGGADAASKGLDSFNETIDSTMEGIDEFVNSFPDKVSEFLSSIPDKITSLLAPSSLENTNDVQTDAEGNVIEDKPSLLGKIVGVFAKIGLSIVKLGVKLPIIISDMIRSAAISMIGSFIGGIGSSFIMLGKVTSNVLSWAANKVGLLSDEEYTAKTAEIDSTYGAAGKAWRVTVATMVNEAMSSSKSLTKGLLGGVDTVSNIVSGKESPNASVGKSTDQKQTPASNTGISKPNTESTAIDVKDSNNKTIAQKKEEHIKKPDTPFVYDPNSLAGKAQAGVAKGQEGFFNKIGNFFGTDNSGVQKVKGEGLQLSYEVGKSSNFGKDQTVDGAIKSAAEYAKAKGMGLLDEKYLSALATIESSYGKAVKPGKYYKGLFQIGKLAADEVNVPYTDEYLLNHTNNARAAVDYMAYTAKELKRLKVPVTPTTLYLSHQQGAGGIASIYRASTKGGIMSNERLNAMFKNVDDQNKPYVKTPADFITYWEARMNNGGNPIKPQQFLAYSQNKSAGKVNMLPDTAIEKAIPKENVKPTVAVGNQDKVIKDKAMTETEKKTNDTISTEKAKQEAITTNVSVDANLNDKRIVDGLGNINSSILTLGGVLKDNKDNTNKNFVMLDSMVKDTNKQLVKTDAKASNANDYTKDMKEKESKAMLNPLDDTKKLVSQ
jgi:hypothetical protein